MDFRDKTAEELRASTALRSHVLRVMGAVEKVVARMDSEDKVVTLLHDLGQRHVVYNARPEFLDVSIRTSGGHQLCLTVIQMLTASTKGVNQP